MRRPPTENANAAYSIPKHAPNATVVTAITELIRENFKSTVDFPCVVIHQTITFEIACVAARGARKAKIVPAPCH